MKDGASYPRNQAIALLLGGNAGSGKTNLSFEFPNPYILDCDHNLRNAIERHPSAKFTWDNPELDAAGNVLPPEGRWARLEALIKENAPKPEVGSLVVDSLSCVTDYLRAYLVHVGSQAEKPLVIGGIRAMTFTLWSPFADLMKRFISLCRAYNKPFVLTCHFKVDENEMTGIKERRVDLQGQLVSSFPKLFTDFWQCQAVPSAADQYKASGGVRYFVRTMPTSQVELKQSCGLPPEFDPGDAPFKALMHQLLTPVPTVQSQQQKVN